MISWSCVMMTFVGCVHARVDSDLKRPEKVVKIIVCEEIQQESQLQSKEKIIENKKKQNGFAPLPQESRWSSIIAEARVLVLILARKQNENHVSVSIESKTLLQQKLTSSKYNFASILGNSSLRFELAIFCKRVCLGLRRFHIFIGVRLVLHKSWYGNLSRIGARRG